MAGISIDSVYNLTARYSREVSRGLWMFSLLFRQESGQGDDISVDILLTNPVSVGSHDDERFKGLMCNRGVSKAETACTKIRDVVPMEKMRFRGIETLLYIPLIAGENGAVVQSSKKAAAALN